MCLSWNKIDLLSIRFIAHQNQPNEQAAHGRTRSWSRAPPRRLVVRRRRPVVRKRVRVGQPEPEDRIPFGELAAVVVHSGILVVPDGPSKGPNWWPRGGGYTATACWSCWWFNCEWSYCCRSIEHFIWIHRPRHLYNPRLCIIFPMASQSRYAELFNPRLQSAMHTNEPTHCAHFGFVFDTQLTWIPFPIRIRTRWFGFVWWKRNQRGHRHTDRREGPVVVTFCFLGLPGPFSANICQKPTP